MINQDLKRILAFLKDDDDIVDPSCRNLLHAYIDAELANEDAASRYPEVAACLAASAQFREEYEIVKTLLAQEADNEWIQPPITADFDFTYLKTARPPRPQYTLSWVLNRIGNLVIELSTKLADRPYMAPLSPEQEPQLIVSGAFRSEQQQLTHFLLKGAIDDLEVEIMAEEQEGDATQCQLIVGVNIPSKGGFPNLAHTKIIMRQEEADPVVQQTDAFGKTVFRQVAITALGHLTFEIIPADS